MCEVLQFRPFQSAVGQAKKLGTNATMAVIRRVREEQRAGRSGNAVAGDLQRERLAGTWRRPFPFNAGPDAA